MCQNLSEKCHSILFARNGRLLAETVRVSADFHRR
jgi:hypothetical protein